MHTLHPCHTCRNLPLPCSQLLQSKNILWTLRIWLSMCQAMQGSPVSPVSTPEVTSKVAESVLRCAVSGLKHIQVCWIWGFGTLPPLQQQAVQQQAAGNPLGFLLETKGLSVSFTDAVLNPRLFNSWTRLFIWPQTLYSNPVLLSPLLLTCILQI